MRKTAFIAALAAVTLAVSAGTAALVKAPDYVPVDDRTYSLVFVIDGEAEVADTGLSADDCVRVLAEEPLAQCEVE